MKIDRIGVCEINTHLSRDCVVQRLDVAPLISKLDQGSAAAAYKHERLFHWPVALKLRMSMTLDMGGGQGQYDKDHM